MDSRWPRRYRSLEWMTQRCLQRSLILLILLLCWNILPLPLGAHQLRCKDQGGPACPCVRASVRRCCLRARSSIRGANVEPHPHSLRTPFRRPSLSPFNRVGRALIAALHKSTGQEKQLDPASIRVAVSHTAALEHEHADTPVGYR